MTDKLVIPIKGLIMAQGRQLFAVFPVCLSMKAARLRIFSFCYLNVQSMVRMRDSASGRRVET